MGSASGWAGAQATPGPMAVDVAPSGLADTVAAAVAACPGVAGLSGGTYGEVATYLPGRRVVGVRLTDPGNGPPPDGPFPDGPLLVSPYPDRPRPGPGVEVHVVAVFGPNVAEVGGQVRAAVLDVAPDIRWVDVTIDDLADGEPA